MTICVGFIVCRILR